MPLIQKRKKLNDFLFGREITYYGPDPVKAAKNITTAILVPTISSETGGLHFRDIGKRDNVVYVYHAEKRRPRWIQVNRKKMINERRTTVSERVHMKHWKIRLFAFPARHGQARRATCSTFHYRTQIKGGIFMALKPGDKVKISVLQYDRGDLSICYDGETGEIVETLYDEKIRKIPEVISNNPERYDEAWKQQTSRQFWVPC